MSAMTVETNLGEKELIDLAEMALAGGRGATIDAMDTPFAFNETQGRYLVTYRPDRPLNRDVVPFERIGSVGGDSLVVNGTAIPLADLRAAHEGFFPALMGADAALA